MKRYFVLIAMWLGLTASTKAADWIDITGQYITNPNFQGNSNQGWTMEAYAGSTTCNYACQEFWQGVWNFYQTVEIPNGHYRISVNGYHRPSGYSNTEVGNYNNGNGAEITSYLYANEESKPLTSAYAHSLTSNYNGGCWTYRAGGGWGGGGGSTAYYPNNMESASYCFSQGLYQNELEFDGTDGPLPFGIRNEDYVESNWTIFTGWRLEYYGDVVQITGITLSKTRATMVPGEQLQLTTTISPANATLRDLTWASSNERIATVDKNGKVTAVETGQAHITATATDGSGQTATCVVTVTSNATGLAKLIVNEIQSANLDQTVDPSWNYGGWVELYNPGTIGVTLTGCWVSDDPDNLQKVHISQPLAIPSKSYACLWFDHHDKYCLTQLDMKLDVEGGTFYLSNSDGKLVLSAQYPPAISRCSYARKALTSDEWGWSPTPTPQASNKGTTYAETRLHLP